MADHSPVDGIDYPAHVQTYRSFLRGVTLFVAMAAITLVLLAEFTL